MGIKLKPLIHTARITVHRNAIRDTQATLTLLGYAQPSYSQTTLPLPLPTLTATTCQPGVSISVSLLILLNFKKGLFDSSHSPILEIRYCLIVRILQWVHLMALLQSIEHQDLLLLLMLRMMNYYYLHPLLAL